MMGRTHSKTADNRSLSIAFVRRDDRAYDRDRAIQQRQVDPKRLERAPEPGLEMTKAVIQPICLRSRLFDPRGVRPL